MVVVSWEVGGPTMFSLIGVNYVKSKQNMQLNDAKNLIRIYVLNYKDSLWESDEPNQ